MTAAHEILGIEPGASPAEVQAAYRRYAARNHPDHGGDPAKFVAGQDAYRRLVGRAAARAALHEDVALTFHRRRNGLWPLRRALSSTVGRLTGRPVPPPRVQ